MEESHVLVDDVVPAVDNIIPAAVIISINPAVDKTVPAVGCSGWSGKTCFGTGVFKLFLNS